MKKQCVLIIALCWLPLSLMAAPLDTEQQQQVRELVRDTLMNDPEILVDVINELKKRQTVAQKQSDQQALEANYQALFENPADPARGAGQGKAKVTLVYFFDFNCSFCKRQETVLERLSKEFPDLRIVYKDFPVLGESSREAAAMALRVHRNDPDKYFQVQERLMSKPAQHTSASIAAGLKVEGVDVEALKQQPSGGISEQINDNIRLASALGIKGTPALVFPDKILGGLTAEAVLTEMIEQRME